MLGILQPVASEARISQHRSVNKVKWYADLSSWSRHREPIPAMTPTTPVCPSADAGSPPSGAGHGTLCKSIADAPSTHSHSTILPEITLASPMAGSQVSRVEIAYVKGIVFPR